MEGTIYIKFDDLTSEQLTKVGIAGRMQSSVSNWMYLTPEMVKLLRLTPEQLSKTRTKHP